MVPHILLEELGVPYERVLVDTAAEANRRPEHLKLNPNGLIPVIEDGEMVLYETAAIALYLCDMHPQAQLAPLLGSPQRAHFYKWLMWLTNTLQAALILYFYPHRWMDEGNEAGVAQLKRHAERKVADLLSQLDGELAHHGEPWFAGDRFSALDPYVFTLCRWTRNFQNERPAREHAHLGPHLQRVLARESVQRVIANENLAPPFV